MLMQLYAQNRRVCASCCGPTLLETLFLDAAQSRRAAAKHRPRLRAQQIASRRFAFERNTPMHPQGSLQVASCTERTLCCAAQCRPKRRAPSIRVVGPPGQMVAEARRVVATTRRCAVTPRRGAAAAQSTDRLPEVHFRRVSALINHQGAVPSRDGSFWAANDAGADLLDATDGAPPHPAQSHHAVAVKGRRLAALTWVAIEVRADARYRSSSADASQSTPRDPQGSNGLGTHRLPSPNRSDRCTSRRDRHSSARHAALARHGTAGDLSPARRWPVPVRGRVTDSALGLFAHNGEARGTRHRNPRTSPLHIAGTGPARTGAAVAGNGTQPEA